MNKPLIVILQQDGSRFRIDPSRLEHMLDALGFEAQVCHRIGQILPNQGSLCPDLFILERPLPEKSSSSLSKTGVKSDPPDPPCIVLNEEVFPRDDPFDILSLHGRIVQKLLRHPRKHLRMAVQLPCVFDRKGRSFFGEILSLGTGGAFVKTSCHHLRAGEFLDLGIPLMGMKKEIEMRSSVLYRINTGPEKNFLQGVGVGFLHRDPVNFRLLQDFIRFSLLNEDGPGYFRHGISSQEVSMPRRTGGASEPLSPRLFLKS